MRKNDPLGEIFLSVPVVKLLGVFVRHPNEIISREFLITEALEKNSLTASSGSLNNYLSHLRKALKPFNLDGDIETFPKTGIRFNVQVNEFVATVASAEFEHTVTAAPEKVRRKTRPAILLASTAMLLMLFILGYFFFYPGKRYTYNDYPMVNDVGDCRLILLNTPSAPEYPEEITRLCKNGNDILFYEERVAPADGNGINRHMVASCRKGITHCENYTYIF